MPYNPKAFTQDDRTWSYNALWLGLPSSILLLASLLFEPLSFVTAISGGFTCGTLIGQAFARSQDEVYRAEVAFGANFALAFAGFALFVQIVPWTRDFHYDAALILAMMASIFHVAIAFRRIRDR
jgi:hypothetical protein